MFDVMNLLISNAWAADVVAPAVAPVAADAAANQDMGSAVMRFMPFFLILGVFYLFVIRPQQKKAEAIEAMLDKLKKGDKVITSGGLIGTIIKIDSERYAVLEIAKGVDVKVVKATITGLFDETVPANQNK